MGFQRYEGISITTNLVVQIAYTGEELIEKRYNETLVGAVIRISDLRDPRRECYQLSHAASIFPTLLVQ
jgi:hypothetical protein